ncbi:hypothetical protein [Piscirickettsia salmonis]|uniref:hypothetical protein n=1 Tax=Piscirickettsia salmonis TaxID=1238 RepID=UPI0012B7F016
MLGDFASLDVQNTYRGSDAYVTLDFPLIVMFEVTIVGLMKINHDGHYFTR